MDQAAGTETSFYDLRWREAGITAADQARILHTLSAVPEDCKEILDVGAGDGRLSHALADTGKLVTAVDISSVALSKLRVPRFQRSCADLGFDAASFDLVLCTEMMEHLEEDIECRARAEFARVARRYILVTVPNDERLEENVGLCRCGTKFHIWGHRRSYRPGSMNNLFPGFSLLRGESFGRETTVYDARLLWLRQHLAGAFSWDANTHCPVCHGPEAAAPRSRFAMRLCDFLNAKLRRTRPAWLLALYRRDDLRTSQA